MKETDIQIVEVSCSTQKFDYRSPMKFGGRVVRDVVLLDVVVKVATKSGKTATGTGSMTMGNIWAWPAGKTDPESALNAMIEFGKNVVATANDFKQFGHPLELAYDFAKSYNTIAENTLSQLNTNITEPIPKLAQLVAASPFEAALFDAYGRLLNLNSYNTLSAEFCNRDLSYYLGDDFKNEFLDQYTLREPKDRMPLYHLVGALDPLTAADVNSPLNDGLPEHFGEWITYNGLTHIKIKLNGDDLDWDVNRVIAIDKICEEIQTKRGCKEWFYSSDFNERCANVEYVLDFLDKIKSKSPVAIHRLQYIEQPTNRNLRAYPENLMHKAAAIKPVVIDESLVDLEALHDSRKMGYSGVALKACKGQAEALLMGAAAQKYKMFLCVQDLTCVGASFLHSATLSARFPGVAAIEGNGRQYCPAANKKWEAKYPKMFIINDGTLGSGTLNEIGLGFNSVE
jgi:L-alanine-DL-glutamate epimerase-like enolase superfamily enzyme